MPGVTIQINEDEFQTTPTESSTHVPMHRYYSIAPVEDLAIGVRRHGYEKITKEGRPVERNTRHLVTWASAISVPVLIAEEIGWDKIHSGNFLGLSILSGISWMGGASVSQRVIEPLVKKLTKIIIPIVEKEWIEKEDTYLVENPTVADFLSDAEITEVVGGVVEDLVAEVAGDPSLSMYGHNDPGAGPSQPTGDTVITINNPMYKPPTEATTDNPVFGGYPSFSKGGLVKRTGLAYIHKNEYVVPARKVKHCNVCK